MNNNIEISIRPETSHQLGLPKNPSLLRFLQEAIKEFCEYNFPTATVTLFKLLYELDKDTRNNFFQKLHFTLYTEESFNPYKKCMYITEDMALIIAKELQFQYLKLHPAFLKVPELYGCEKELSSLQHKVEESDPLLFYSAVKSIQNIHHTQASACIKLLTSKSEASQVEGLQMLKHNRRYQQLLLPYANEIGQLLQTYSSSKSQRVSAAQEELNNCSLPFIIPEAVPSNSSCKVTSERNSYIKNYSVSPNLATLINSKSLLISTMSDSNEFWKFMKNLRTSGIDLNLLVDKMDCVLAILNAHDDLEKATQLLVHADEEHCKAKQLYLVNETRENLYNFINAAETFYESMDIYNAAFDSFIKSQTVFENAVV